MRSETPHSTARGSESILSTGSEARSQETEVRVPISRSPHHSLVTFLRTFTITLLVFSALTVWTTSKAGTPSPYRVINWQVEDGLPQNTIHRITQTADGYLWLATPQRVIRFDGREFRSLTSEGADRFGLGNISCLTGDRSGRLWIGADQELLQYTPGTLAKIPIPSPDRSGTVKSVSEAPDGQIYVATQYDLFRLESDQLVSMKAGHPEAPEAGYFTTVDTMNRLWVAWGNTLYRYENNQWSTEVRFPHIINSLSEDAEGMLWCGLNAGYIASLKPGNTHELKFFEGGSVFEIARNHNGETLFRISDRLHRFPDGEYVPLHLPNREPIERIQSIYQDRENNIWLGTKGKGLVLLQPQPLTSYSTPEGLPYPEVRTIEQVPGDGIWVGTTGGGMAKLEEQSFQAIDFAHSTSIGSILHGKNGKTWIGTYGNHLWTLDDGNNHIETRSRALAGRCLFEDSEGALWVGGDGMGAERFLRDQELRLDTGRGLASDNVRCFAEGASGAIWIGTDRGLYRYSEGTVETFQAQPSLRDAHILTLFVDSQETLWVGTEYRGLTRYRRGEFQTVRSEKGPFSESIAQLVEDDFGHLWMGTNRRLYRSSIEALNDLFDGTEKRLQGTSFGKEEGMRSQECTSGFQPNSLKTKDGTLWFSTADGIVRADPLAIRSSGAKPQVHIDLFLADSKPVFRELVPMTRQTDTASNLGYYDPPRDSEIQAPPFVVPAGTGRLEIHFTGISFTSPKNVQYRYRLKGYDSAWIPSGAQRIAAYTQVTPGRYEFEVQANTSDQNWNPGTATLAFVVEPTISQTWWFQVSAVIVVVSVLLALTYGPIHRRRQMERLRLQIARDLHDEVGSNLGSISLYSQLAEEKTGQRSAAADEFKEINRTVQQTVQSLRDVIWFTNPKFDTLRGMLQQMEDTANRMLAGKSLSFDTDCSSPDRILSLNFRRQVFLIFREILHNILKHSQADQVEITISLQRNNLILRVADSGVGFESGKETKGYGLNNIQTRAEELGGRIEVHPQPGQGTVIKLEVPVT